MRLLTRSEDSLCANTGIDIGRDAGNNSLARS